LDNPAPLHNFVPKHYGTSIMARPVTVTKERILLGISPASVTKARQRLKAKMG